jgi:hypothetical protein
MLEFRKVGLRKLVKTIKTINNNIQYQQNKLHIIISNPKTKTTNKTPKNNLVRTRVRIPINLIPQINQRNGKNDFRPNNQRVSHFTLEIQHPGP